MGAAVNDGVVTSVMVKNEIYSILMDIYGSDECYNDVFLKCRALSVLEETLPLFRSCIKLFATWQNKYSQPTSSSLNMNHNEGSSNRNRDITNALRETTLNLSRFIKYKKNQLN